MKKNQEKNLIAIDFRSQTNFQNVFHLIFKIKRINE